MSEFLNNLYLGLISGVASGFLVYFAILRNNLRSKANVLISTEIAKSSESAFKIKIVNKAKYDVVNLQAELSAINFYTVPNGIETNSKPIKLVKDSLFVLGRSKKSKDKTGNNFKFISREDLTEILNNRNIDYLRFRIFFIDSFSNLGKVYERNFYKSSVKNGDFQVGDSLKID